MEPNFIQYKAQLLEILMNENYHGNLIDLVDQLNGLGHTKMEIYNLFSTFHQQIQVDRRTHGNEDIYNRLSNFMDGFTAWGKSFRILPHEPDL